MSASFCSDKSATCCRSVCISLWDNSVSALSFSCAAWKSASSCSALSDLMDAYSSVRSISPAASASSETFAGGAASGAAPTRGATEARET